MKSRSQTGKVNFCKTCTEPSFPDGSVGKESACNVGDPGLIPAWGNPLEKEMATHSSILAWRIPWTEEPGELRSVGSQRVRHDRVTNTFTLYPTKNLYLEYMKNSNNLIRKSYNLIK